MLTAIPARSAGTFVASLTMFVVLLAGPPAATAQEADYAAPRTPWGAPDLNGVWSNATTTPLQRPAELGDQAFFTEEERVLRNPDSGVSTEERSQYMPTGAYNDFWLEQGELNLRTSLVIDPPSGRLPALTGPEQARQRLLPNSFSPLQTFDSWLDFNTYDRCITRGMPGSMMPGFYNHNYQIVQTEDHVAILVEMIHDARIVPIGDGRRLDPAVEQWLGDSRGYWDGDTLVIETRNFTDKVGTRGGVMVAGSQHLRTVERLTRVSDNVIDYEITVHDPTVWSAPWTVSVPMSAKAMEDPIYEYACHEGNYALPNILAGQRAQDAEAASR